MFKWIRGFTSGVLTTLSALCAVIITLLLAIIVAINEKEDDTRKRKYR